MSKKQEFPPLFQAGFHEITLSTLRELCVDNFPDSDSRELIMQGVEKLCSELSGKVIKAEIWVNGSFLTEKLNPEDSDIAVRVFDTVVDNATTEQMELLFKIVDQDFHGNFKCDSYVFCEYAEGDDRYSEGEWDRSYWIRQFGFNRGDNKKGIALIRTPINE